MNNVKIFMLCGKARSGKDTIAKMIQENLNKKNVKSIIISYTFYLKEYVKNISDWDGLDDNKPRTLLQKTGDLLKDIDECFLTNRVIQDILFYSKFYDAIIITGARLKSEIESIKNNFNNVTTIKVIGFNSDLTEEEKKHITEIDLDNYAFDYEIVNKSIKQQEIDILMEELYE